MVHQLRCRLAPKSLLWLVITFAAMTCPVGQSGAGERDVYLSYVNSAFWTGINDVKVQDSIAYCAADFGLILYDVRTPNQPKPIGQLFFQSPSALLIDIRGDTAYVVAGFAGIFVVDVSDPQQPTLIGHIAAASFSSDIALDDTMAYVLDYSTGLYIINISEPQAPVEISHLDLGGQASTIAYKDSVVYVGNVKAGLQLINVADPALPTLMGRNDYLDSICDIAVFGNKAIVTKPQVCFSLDLSDAASPVILDLYAGGSSHAAMSDWVDSLIYVALSGDGVWVLNASNPADLLHLATIKKGEVDRLDVGNDRLYAATGSGLDVYELGVADSIERVGSSFPSIEFIDMDRLGNLLYLTSRDDSSVILDISDPTHPTEAGAFPCPGNGRWVATVDGNYLYQAGSYPLLAIYDLSAPRSPVLVRTLDSGDFAFHALAVRDTVAFIGAGGVNFRTLSIADPANPRYLGSCEIGGTAVDIALWGTLAFAAAREDGLCVVDVSDPATPILRSKLSLPGSAWSVRVEDTLVFVNAYSKLLCFNASNPDSLIQIGEYSTSLPVTIAHMEDDLFYLLSFGNLEVVDVSDPTAPVVAASYSNLKAGVALAKVDPYLFALGPGLVVLEQSVATSVEQPDAAILPRGATLSAIYPNPFNSSTNIRFALPVASTVRLSIHNVLGQQVGMLIEEVLPAGDHSLTWRGRDSDGRSLGSGVYFMVLEANGKRVVQKGLMLK